jgi:hypothetical protein
MIVLALLAGAPGCLYPGRDWRGNWQRNRYEQGGQGGQGNQSARDCFSRDGHWYCRDGN